ncbi:MAG: hypothetical protein FVQ79_01700 [Planctomycetes bacterium]|nr:hypothetical protein [Planctomycetota bacterium]
MKDARLIALGVYLRELRIEPHDIEKFEGRKMTQKAVYLAQYDGADLGYRYIWDSKGPYSPALAEDYNALMQAYLINPKLLEGKTIIESYTSVIHKICDLIYSKDKPDLETHQWVELLASLHYLQKVSEFSYRKSRTYLGREKPELSKYISKAEAELKNVSLL